MKIGDEVILYTIKQPWFGPDGADYGRVRTDLMPYLGLKGVIVQETVSAYFVRFASYKPNEFNYQRTIWAGKALVRLLELKDYIVEARKKEKK